VTRRRAVHVGHPLPSSKPDVGDRIRLSAAQFERLSEAFFIELQSKFL